MSDISKDFIKKIPKTDLHLHLDGSLRIPTLIDIAKNENIQLPSFTEEGLKEKVFKDSYANLDEYLHGFGLTTQALQNHENLERCAYELAEDSYSEGVFYIEVRFAPQLHMHSELEFDDVMKAVDKGLRRFREKANADRGSKPPFEYGIIVCAMRYFSGNFSSYFKDFFRVHSFSSKNEVFSMASLELVKAAVKLRNTSDVQIVGFDLAGSEYGNPAAVHAEAYDYAHKHFLNKTVHAGEAYGPESIFQAITDLHADRIGHGLHLFDTTAIKNVAPEHRDRYVDQLAQYIADKRITLEVCLTSNLQTTDWLDDIKKHSLKKMLEKRISISFCTDNRLVSHTTVSNEIELAVKNFDISKGRLKNIIIYGFKRSFFYHPYIEKRAYVREIIDYYDSVAGGV